MEEIRERLLKLPNYEDIYDFEFESLESIKDSVSNTGLLVDKKIAEFTEANVDDDDLHEELYDAQERCDALIDMIKLEIEERSLQIEMTNKFEKGVDIWDFCPPISNNISANFETPEEKSKRKNRVNLPPVPLSKSDNSPKPESNIFEDTRQNTSTSVCETSICHSFKSSNIPRPDSELLNLKNTINPLTCKDFMKGRKNKTDWKAFVQRTLSQTKVMGGKGLVSKIEVKNKTHKRAKTRLLVNHNGHVQNFDDNIKKKQKTSKASNFGNTFYDTELKKKTKRPPVPKAVSKEDKSLIKNTRIKTSQKKIKRYYVGNNKSSRQSEKNVIDVIPDVEDIESPNTIINSTFNLNDKPLSLKVENNEHISTIDQMDHKTEGSKKTILGTSPGAQSPVMPINKSTDTANITQSGNGSLMDIHDQTDYSPLEARQNQKTAPDRKAERVSNILDPSVEGDPVRPDRHTDIGITKAQLESSNPTDESFQDVERVQDTFATQQSNNGDDVKEEDHLALIHIADNDLEDIEEEEEENTEASIQQPIKTHPIEPKSMIVEIQEISVNRVELELIIEMVELERFELERRQDIGEMIQEEKTNMENQKTKQNERLIFLKAQKKLQEGITLHEESIKPSIKGEVDLFQQYLEKTESNSKEKKNNTTVATSMNKSGRIFYRRPPSYSIETRDDKSLSKIHSYGNENKAEDPNNSRGDSTGREECEINNEELDSRQITLQDQKGTQMKSSSKKYRKIKARVNKRTIIYDLGMPIVEYQDIIPSWNHLFTSAYLHGQDLLGSMREVHVYFAQHLSMIQQIDQKMMRLTFSLTPLELSTEAF